MGWRENMGVLKTKTYSHNSQNTQKRKSNSLKKHFEYFGNNENTLSKIKTDPAPPLDLSKIRPEHRSEYTDLWHRACELENYTSGDAPYQDRAARMPELNELVERMRVLEDKTKIAPTRPVKDKPIPGLPDDLIQAPAVWMPGSSTVQTNQGEYRDTCPACGQRQWWRKNEPGAKWICGRCHPPASGLDVIFRNE